jgi:hypothetical protein
MFLFSCYQGSEFGILLFILFEGQLIFFGIQPENRHVEPLKKEE